MKPSFTNPLFIFDLDGTLANCEHRRPFLKIKTDKRRWERFYTSCRDDLPIKAVVDTYNLLPSSVDRWVFSGREESQRLATMDWFRQVGMIRMPDAMLMRPTGDSTEDHVLKQSWLDLMFDEDRARLVAVYDDRNRVVEMWRKNGIQCFQVAPGDF